jgi:hypothetical protein
VPLTSPFIGQLIPADSPHNVAFIKRRVSGSPLNSGVGRSTQQIQYVERTVTNMSNNAPKVSSEKIRPTAHDPDLRYKFWQLFATYASLVVAILGIWFVVRSLDNNTKSVRSGVQQSMLSLVTDMDKVFVDKPELYPYFNRCQELKLGPNDPKSDQVIAAAVQMLDVFDIAAAQSTRFRDQWEDPDAWDNWIKDQFIHSPILRKVLHDHKSWYSKGLNNRLNEAEKELIKMEQENKQPCS